MARAWAGLAASVAVVGLVAGSAWHVQEPGPPRAGVSLPPTLPELPPRPVQRDVPAYLAVVDRAPFRPDRTRPAMRYQMPSERRAVLSAPGRPAHQAFRLTGLVLNGSGRSLAAIGRAGQPTRLFPLGSMIDGFELVAIENGTATLEGPDTTIVLEMPRPRGGPR